MGSVRLLRRLAGKGSWIFSIAPRTRWTISRLWAVITQVANQGTVCSKLGRGGGPRFGLFARSQAELPLKWILAYWGSSHAPLKRTLGAHVPPASMEIVTDACPWGLGGYLQSKASGEILEYFSSALSESDASRFGVDIGSASGQQIWEALAILVGIRIWGRHFSNGKARLQVRGDSMVALSLATRLASPSATLNAIGAEIALDLELLNIDEVFTTHTPGRLLNIADDLSRVSAPSSSGELPVAVSKAKARTPMPRSDDFYKVWCITARAKK